MQSTLQLSYIPVQTSPELM